MRTTFELPEVLLRELEKRAEDLGQPLEQTVQELLCSALSAIPAETRHQPPAIIRTNPETGLPCLEPAHPAIPGQELTADRVADILLEQEVTWHHEAGR